MKITKEIEKLHRESVIFDGLLMWGNLDRVNRGFSSEDAKKLWGGNFLRVLGNIWGEQ